MRARFFQIVSFFCIAFITGMVLMMLLRGTIETFGPVGIDLYPRWVGGRAMWRGESPYSQAVKVQSQQLISGRPSRPDENAHGFYYPAYIAVIILPLLFLPVDMAGIIWSAILWAMLITLVVWWSWQLDPRPAPWVWGLLLISVLLFRPSVLSVITGQYGLFVLVCGILAWLLISRGWDGWAGIALAFASIKPSISAIALLLILGWGVYWKRWKIISGFGITMIALVGITLLRIGWWIPDFIHQAMTYSQDNRGVGLVWSPEEILTVAGLAWFVSSLALTGLGLGRVRSDPKFPLVAIIGALNLNLLLTPHTLEYDLILLLALLFWLGTEWCSKSWGTILWIILVWVPWLSWAAIVLAGRFSLQDWRLAIWQFYPTLLLVVSLIWLARDKFQDWIHRRCAIVA